MEHAGRRGRRRGARAPASHAAAEHVGAPFPHDVHVTFGRVHVAGRDVRPTPRATPRTRELLRCGGDVDGLTALFLGPLGGPLLLDVLLRLPLLALLAALVLRVHGLPFDGDAPIMRYVRSVRASRTSFRMPVMKGTSSFVYRRAGDSRSARMHSTMRDRSSASKARIHSQSLMPNALVVLARTSGNRRPRSPCSRSSASRSPGGSKYHSEVRTNG